MSNETEPFTPFKPNDPPPAPNGSDPKPQRNRRKRGEPKASPRVAGAKRPGRPVKAVAEPAPKAPRKPRKARAPNSIKVDFATALSATAGLKPEDAHLLTQMVSALQGTKKAGRERILNALGKVFT